MTFTTWQRFGIYAGAVVCSIGVERAWPEAAWWAGWIGGFVGCAALHLLPKRCA